MKWKRINCGPIDVPLENYLENIIKEEQAQGNNLRIAIGTDSQKRGKGYKFGVAIVIMRSINLGNDKFGNPISKGLGAIVIGTTFWNELKAKSKGKKIREIEVLNERMMLEVSTSIEIAYSLTDLLNQFEIPLEIHADINPDINKGLSNIALNSAVGYILGMGYEFKVKPSAYAASSAADKLC